MAAPKAAFLGKKTGQVTLDEAVFGEAFHEPLVHRAVTAELNARRRGTASTLTRGQVAMTGAKAWRQKGTGRARAGALSSPQRTGGGVAFGPKPRRYTVKVNRKERRRALRAALSVHSERGSLGALDAGSFSAPSTKQAAEALTGFGEGGHVLVVLVDGEETAALSFRNLPRVKVLRARDVGVADVIGAARLAASPGAFEELAQLAAAPVARVAGGEGSSARESEAS
ncbi:MAG: 50S ribosomal protein L4 [Thermoleophilaceae bacterium]|nr:50S ribosomal protein L4 [Thermoleophilaceae bacterium]